MSVLIRALLLIPYVAVFSWCAPGEACANDLQIYPPRSTPELSTIAGRVLRRNPEPRFEKRNWLAFVPSVVPDIDLVRIGDFNGDGFDDLLIPAPDGSATVARSDGQGRFLEERWPGFPEDFDWRRAAVGRFDFDRCADVAGPATGHSTEIILARSSCNGSFSVVRAKVLPEFDADALTFAARLHRHLIASFITFEKLTSELHGVQYQLDGRFSHFEFGLFGYRSLLGFLDVNGDGLNEATQYDAETKLWFSRLNPAPDYRAQFPFGGARVTALSGDFDGNGADDILVSEIHPIGWWVALNGERSAVERPVPGLPLIEAPSITGIRTADLDGDHVTEVIDLRSFPSEVSVYFARFTEGVAEVRLELKDGTGAASDLVTDSHGRFELIVKTAVPSDIRPSDPRFLFFPEHRPTHNAQPFRYLPFIAEAKDDPRLGRAVRVEGPTSGPSLCIGYLPTMGRQKWGRLLHGTCPEGYAIWGVDDTRVLYADCCKLPADDILLREETSAEHECPNGYVAVGGDNTQSCRSGTCGSGGTMFCRKVNDARYQLGSPSAGVYWSQGPSSSDIQLRRLFGLASPRTILRDTLPIAIRFGFGRVGYNNWDIDGCIGTVPGSLLMKRGGRECDSFAFRELQYRGAPGDPPRGTPVKMFPDCREISHVYDPEAYCVR